MVTEGAIFGENLLARAPGCYGLENAVQLLPRLFWFHTRLRMSLRVVVVTAFMVPRRCAHPPEDCLRFGFKLNVPV